MACGRDVASERRDTKRGGGGNGKQCGAVGPRKDNGRGNGAHAVATGRGSGLPEPCGVLGNAGDPAAPPPLPFPPPALPPPFCRRTALDPAPPEALLPHQGPLCAARRTETRWCRLRALLPPSAFIATLLPPPVPCAGDTRPSPTLQGHGALTKAISPFLSVFAPFRSAAAGRMPCHPSLPPSLPPRRGRDEAMGSQRMQGQNWGIWREVGGVWTWVGMRRAGCGLSPGPYFPMGDVSRRLVAASRCPRGNSRFLGADLSSCVHHQSAGMAPQRPHCDGQRYRDSQ